MCWGYCVVDLEHTNGGFSQVIIFYPKKYQTWETFIEKRYRKTYSRQIITKGKQYKVRQESPEAPVLLICPFSSTFCSSTVLASRTSRAAQHTWASPELSELWAWISNCPLDITTNMSKNDQSFSCSLAEWMTWLSTQKSVVLPPSPSSKKFTLSLMPANSAS